MAAPRSDRSPFRGRPAGADAVTADGDVAPEFDIDGNPRHHDPGMPNAGRGSPPYADIGAYQFQGRSRITPFGGGCVPAEGGTALALGLVGALFFLGRRRP
jgi:hypothetical protein